MPTLSLSSPSSINGGQCWVNISGLSSFFNTTYYMSAGICTGTVTDGSSTAPSGIVSTLNAPSSGTNTYAAWTAINLGYGVKYYNSYVRAANGKYYSTGSSSVSVPPALPTGVSTSTNSNGTFTISFTKGTGAYNTYVDYSWIAGIDNANTTGTSFSGSGLASGSYTFALASKTLDNVKSAYSSNYSLNIPYTAPSLPTNVNTINITQTSARVSFTKGTGAYYTNLDASWDAGGLDGNMDYNTNGSYIDITGLTAGTSYSFKLQSERSSSEGNVKSSWSSVYTFITLPPIPSAPSPSISSRSEGGITWSWSSVLHATSYNVRYKLSSDSTYTSESTTSTSYIKGSLNYGTNYDFSVQSVNASGSSSWSTNVLSTTLPKTPVLSYSSKTSSSVTLNVSGMSGNYTDFSLEYRLSGGSWTAINNISFPYTVNGLNGSTTYDFRTRSRYFYSGVSYYSASYSNTITQTTEVPIPNTPSPPSISSKGEGTLTWAWSTVQYASGYNISYWKHGYSETLGSTTLTSFSHDCDYGALYYAKISAYNTSGVSSYSSNSSVAISLPKTPTISLYSSTNTSVTIDITNMIGSYSDFSIEYKLSANSWSSAVITTTSSTRFTISGLTSASEYNFRIRSRYTYSGSDYYSYSYSNVLTIELGSRPSVFLWDYTRTQGMDYATNKIRASEWTRLQQNINELRLYKGLSLYGFSSVSQGDVFLSAHWNAVINAITAMNGYYTISPPSTKSSGNSIVASEFETIKSCINSIT